MTLQTFLAQPCPLRPSPLRRGTVSRFRGEKLFEQRLSTEAQIYASLVAADGKVFCPSLDGDVYVLKAGDKYELLARNHMGEPCFATPAITKNLIYFRTTESLIAVG